MPEDLDERIVIRHTDGKSNGVATRRQLNELWAGKGFKEVKGADPGNPNPEGEQESVTAAAAPRAGGVNG
ncbi:MAG: hypothetical protein ACR2M4_06400 [Actinomycetota bacterium]